MQYKITIIGSGTPEQLEIALREVARKIQDAAASPHEKQLLDGAEWRDGTLNVEIDKD